MPQIRIIRPGPPHVPEHVEDQLLEMDPPVFLKWDPTYKKSRYSDGVEFWEGRWVIYVKLRQHGHPDARHQLSDIDEYFSEHGAWARKLQTYTTSDDGFAPAGPGLVKGLRLADAWSRRNLYEQTVEASDEAQREQRRKRLREVASSSASYYDKYDEPIVGPDTLGNWRHRIRSSN